MRSLLVQQLFRTNPYYTRWEEAVAGVRGAVDLNDAYDDGAVIRLNKALVNDRRTAALAYQSDTLNWSLWLIQLLRP